MADTLTATIVGAISSPTLGPLGRPRSTVRPEEMAEAKRRLRAALAVSYTARAYGQAMADGDRRRLIGALITAGKRDADRIAEQLQSGAISALVWLRSFVGVYRPVQLAAAMVGAGREDIPPPLLARAEESNDEAVPLLARFAQVVLLATAGRNIAAGLAAIPAPTRERIRKAADRPMTPRELAAEAIKGGKLAARMGLYVGRAWLTQELVRQGLHVLLGYAWERNILGDAEHCAECVEATLRGWVPIGTLPRIGARLCMVNCRCTMRFARGVNPPEITSKEIA